MWNKIQAMFAILKKTGDSNKVVTDSRPFWWTIPPWIALGFALVALALYGIDRIETHLLEQEAENAALKYAEFIELTVPDLDLVFDNNELTDRARLELKSSEQLGDVFRFKLFNSSGRQLLQSDDLESENPFAAFIEDRSQESSLDHGNIHVSDIVLAGKNYVELADGREKPDRPDLYSEVYVPLMGPEGILGVVEVYVDQSERQRRIASAFTKVAALIALLLLAGALAITSQVLQRQRDRVRVEKKIRYLAQYDTLTGALNRASFEEILEATVQKTSTSDGTFAIHCIDLDQFKAVNDTLGHAAGDQVLREVVSRLNALNKPGDVLARLGGDEFVIMQMMANSPQEVEAYGLSIVDTLSEPFESNANRVPCGASVGAARFGADALEVHDLLHKADLAMYRSKTSGRGRFCFYDESLDSEFEERRLLTIDLRTAVADKVLSLHYQPLFDATNPDSAVGYEALMRWEHPTRGNIPPGIFIPLAEQTGHIVELGTWAIQQACRDAAAWADETRVAVNLSPAQFADNAVDVVSVVAEALEQHKLDPGRLEVEITESLLISEPESVLNSLHRLSELGVRIAMDDFGTGYSSLSYLWRFPFNKVKIDRSFVMELEEEGKVSVIIESIVSLAHSLGMRVNAEGVETESQRDALRQLGCDELQGFLLGRPAPLDSAESDVQRAA